MLLYPHLMAKHCLRVGWKLRFFPDLRHETRQHGAVKVWWRDLQSCWECSSLCYTSIQCQTSTIQQPTCCYTPTWWPNIALRVGRKSRFFSWSEAWNPPTWGCKSMVEGLIIMLVSVHWPSYTSIPMPNIYYSSNLTCCYTPTWWPNIAQEVGWKLIFFPDLRHETRQHGAVKVWWRDL